ncbi:MAG: hypothetical protein ACWGMZ_11085 [Thermoguttaceae bacterium]
MPAQNSRKNSDRNPTGNGKSPKALAQDKNLQRERSFGSAKLWEDIARYIAYVLILTAVLSGFLYVHAYGVNMIRLDEWDILPVLREQYSEGKLTAASFWEQHNEHRIFFPKLAILGLGLLTNGNVVANMYFEEMLMAGSLAVFIFAFRKQFTSGASILLMAPMAFLFFSLRQYQNMLWGVQIIFAMLVFAVLCAFLALSRITDKRYLAMFVGAIVSATVASFSMIEGLLAWPIGLGQLLMAPLSKRLKIWLAVIWSIIGAGEWIVYFLHWTKPKNHPPFEFSLQYFLTLAGGSLSANARMALIAGTIILLLAVAATIIVVIKRQLSVQSFWLATIGFSLGTLGEITIGRSGFNVMQALSSRYAAFSIPLVVATYVVLASQSGKKNRICLVLTITIGIMAVFGTAGSFIDGLAEAEAERNVLKWQQFVLCTIDLQPDEVIKLYPSPDIPRKYAKVLKKLKYHVFADPELCESCRMPDPSLPELDASTKFSIETIAPAYDGNLVSVSGWAVDWPARDLAGGVVVFIDGIPHLARYGIQNYNAVELLKNNKFLHSGFDAIVPAKLFRPGKHTISIKILSHDRKAIFNIPDKSLQVD